MSSERRLLLKRSSSSAAGAPPGAYTDQLVQALREIESLQDSNRSIHVAGDRIQLAIQHLKVQQLVVIEWTERALLIIRSGAGFTIPESSREDASEFLVRTNWNLSLGNFEMDLADGEVRFKTSFFFKGPGDIKSIFKLHMNASIEAFQKCIPQIKIAYC
jgi:hypothetical protein